MKQTFRGANKPTQKSIVTNTSTPPEEQNPPLGLREEFQAFCELQEIDDSIPIITNWWLARISEQRTALIEGVVKMADELEAECNRDEDKGTKQWMAFKGF